MTTQLNMNNAQRATSRLPDWAQAKLAALLRQAEEAQSAMVFALNRRNDLKNQASYSGNRDAMQAQLREYEDAHYAHRQRHELLANLTANLRQWIGSVGPGFDFKAVRWPEVKLKADQTFKQYLHETRNKILSLDVDRQRIRTAPLPRSEIKAKLRDHVDRLAANGAPAFSIANDKVKLDLPDDMSWSGTSAQRALCIVAWLHRDALLKKLEAALDVYPEGEGALTATQRKEKLAKLGDEIDKAERLEEAIIEKAAEEGIHLDRRVTASPAAVLGVRLVAKAAEQPSPQALRHAAETADRVRRAGGTVRV